MTYPPTWTVDTATGGIPQTAHCQRCGERWRRPQGDRFARTFNFYARNHHCEAS